MSRMHSMFGASRARSRRARFPFRFPSAVFLCIAFSIVSALAACGALEDAFERGGPGDAGPANDATGVRKWRVTRQGALTKVADERGNWRATFTAGARLVNLSGPARVFSEATAKNPVSHAIWVRALPKGFDGRFDPAWLSRALAANARKTPDLLAVGMEYVDGAPARLDAAGRQFAGDAHYGPIDEETGSRLEGSDVQDYLQTKSGAGARTREALDPARARSLDCSGFMRMILGYRNNYEGSGYDARFPLETPKATPRAAILPRTAEDLYYAGKGVVIIRDRGAQASAYQALLPGDLVFFQAEDPPERRIDHVGLFLGRDAAGHWRFLSSRKSADGPTMGDTRGMSVLDGTGLYARGFRAARRY